MFAPLSVAAKEFVASSLIPMTVSPGTEIIRQGDGGDRFYVVVDGDAEVTRDGRHVVDRGPGDYFGEIALLRNVPRTATVTARTPMELYGLDRDDFLAAVTGHSAGRAASEAVVVERLATLEPPPEPTPTG
jgi:CRP-like cAMP-binding protein